MTGKQNAIFWIGLFMILINFWVSGQSTILWQTLTNPGAQAAKTTPQRSQNPGSPGSQVGSPGSQVGGGIPRVNVPPGP